MPIICPTVLAETAEIFRHQMDQISKFADRIQIDLCDGQFADSHTIKPERAWWPTRIQADLHLMFKHPTQAVKTIVEHQPHMIIVHAEAEADFEEIANFCRAHHVKIGIALLPMTPITNIVPVLEQLDHVMIFSGELGHFGGHAELGLLEKVSELKRIKPGLEIGWDGGVNDQNVSALVSGGVDVLNVGSFIQKSPHAFRSFQMLQRIANETGTT